jgi:hypothetical protein
LDNLWSYVYERSYSRYKRNVDSNLESKIRTISIRDIFEIAGCSFVNNKATIVLSFSAFGYMKTSYGTEKWTDTVTQNIGSMLI